MGTIINCITIIIGSIIGSFLKNGISEKIQKTIYKSIGLAIIILGINGMISNMVTIENNKLVFNYELILIISVVIGGVIGSFLKIEDRIDNFGIFIENKFKVKGFAKSFMVGSIIFCVGAMAIIGSLNDGLLNDPSVLYIKALLDGITSIILSATLGIGVLFSFILVGLYQGSITILSANLSLILNGELLNMICVVGYFLVIAIGINFIWDKKFKVADLLPSILVPIFYYFITKLF